MEPVELAKEEYIALRAEICQSITYQHQILMGGYGLAAAAVGAIVGSSAVGQRALVVVPIILLGMVCLWAVECNRMVRASYYIAYELWPRMCRLTQSDTSPAWETWIRKSNGHAGSFRKRQHTLQQVVTILVPGVFSAAATGIALSRMIGSPFWFWTTVASSAFQWIVWVVVYSEVSSISDLGAVSQVHDDHGMASSLVTTTLAEAPESPSLPRSRGE